MCSVLQAPGKAVCECHVSVCTSTGKRVRMLRKNLLRQHFSAQYQKGNGMETKNAVHSLKDRENLKKLLERKVDAAVRGWRMVQRKLCTAEAEVEAKNWEKWNFEFASRERDQSIIWISASWWADQAQRDKLACLKNWNLEIGSSRKTMQENAKKLKNWEEFVVKKQIKQDLQEMKNCPCNNRDILRLWVRWLLKFRFFRTKWIPWMMQENFTILNQEAALQRPTSLIQLLRWIDKLHGGRLPHQTHAKWSIEWVPPIVLAWLDSHWWICLLQNEEAKEKDKSWW